MTKQIRAMYFTGTETTSKITKCIADGIYNHINAKVNESDTPTFARGEDINFSPKAARAKAYTFDENDIVVFGTPVIAGRVPNVLLKFLDTLQGGGAMAIPVVLYGNRNFDDALIELRNILESKGFHTVAAAAFIGEHSFSKTLAAGRPDAADMTVAEHFAEEAAEKILGIIETVGDKDVPGSSRERIAEFFRVAGPIDVDGEEPIRPYYQPRDRHGNHINILKVIPKLNADKCTGCGKCVEACPMGSIKAEAPGIVDGICIKCCGCVKKCPEEALYFDDAGYIYHKEELEAMYAERKEPALFI